MKRSNTVIIGAGQSGLAMSLELSNRSIDHVILERGKVANSWRKERWESLRLLTPNWMNGLPSAPYSGVDADGYMHVSEFADNLSDFATAIGAPVMEETSVLGVSSSALGFRVQTDQGAIDCENVVVATGAASRASRPVFARDLPSNILQISPMDYKRADGLPPGKVLVVGASASGIQIAQEVHNSGRNVTIAVGEHTRVPRSYRNADILKWMEVTGRWCERYDSVEDLERQRRAPSLQLTGQPGRNPLDLNVLQDNGIEIVGRVAGVQGETVMFSGSLANVCAAADLKMNRLLSGFDDWALDRRLFSNLDVGDRPAHTRVPAMPRLSVDVNRDGFDTVIWATGFRPEHSWIDLHVFDRKGRIRHDGGIVLPGLYVMGLPFLRQRKSTFIDGAARDARDLANHLAQNLGLNKAA